VPRVTVIIPTYNWSSVLPYSIGSVLRQTYGDYELIVVGDGCTDDSEQVVRSFDDPRIQWINLPENSRHQSGPNNAALAKARGEYIAYLGHDDIWLSHHLEAMIARLDGEKADLAYALIANVEPDGLVWPTVPRPSAGIFSSPLGIVHRKRVTDELGGWRHYRDVKDPPDADLWRRAQAAGFRFTFLPRLTGIKFAASRRRDVYKKRPCHEQALWTARIESDPNFETTQMAQIIADAMIPTAMFYRDLVRTVLRQTIARAKRRVREARLPGMRRRSIIDDIRRFKGL
jgi:glycosyltransferase involved in cell wall biosynthesis